MTNRFVACTLAVWMISVAFLGLAVQAAPQHLVGGGLFGPGVAPGPTNPANVAEFVFYSPNQLAHPLLTGASTLDPANGVDPAVWSKEVGDTWNWAAGDQIVAVAETRRGVNGWTGTNRTSSIDGVLQVGGTTQDLGNGTLEALPTLAATAGSDYVEVSWTGLLDGNGNIVSYEVFTGGGFTTPIARVMNGTALSANHTGLGPGMHCYAVGVNYRRDLSTGVYTTQGLSEPVCATIVDLSPTIVSTSPTDEQVGISPTAPIIITFSEQMDPGPTNASISPMLTLTESWNTPTNTVLTLNHVATFTGCTRYTVTVVGFDMTGNALVGGSIPNPFDFVALCPAPFIVMTTPSSGAAQVPTDSTIEIEFSEEIDTTTFVYTITPLVSIAFPPTWNSPTNDTVTLTPTAGLEEGRLYTVNVTAARDVDGNALLAGSAPNPWMFTVNRKPTANFNIPVGLCRTGGSSLSIDWTMGDPGETPNSNLLVTLRYQETGGPAILITGPTPGLASPRAWDTPTTINGDIQILVEVEDDAGETALAMSAPVKIDNTAPTVVSFSPSDGATGVATDTPVVIRFSEAMATAVTQTAVVITPSPVGTPTPAWTVGNTVLTITAAFQASTDYTVTVNIGARDACEPGLPLAALVDAGFRTGAGPSKTPNRPTNLQATASANAIQLTWDPPTQYSDGSPIDVSDIDVYIVFRSETQGGAGTQVATPTGTTFTDTNVQGGVLYYYWVRVRDDQGRVSPDSDVVSVRLGAPGDSGFTLLLLLIPLIVILLVLGIWLMRRKPAGTAPPPGAQPAGPPGRAGAVGAEPKGEVAPEESPPDAESGETGEFKACPNCGTMVKPTDAECFVCGAKL